MCHPPSIKFSAAMSGRRYYTFHLLGKFLPISSACFQRFYVSHIKLCAELPYPQLRQWGSDDFIAYPPIKFAESNKQCRKVPLTYRKNQRFISGLGSKFFIFCLLHKTHFLYMCITTKGKRFLYHLPFFKQSLVDKKIRANQVYLNRRGK